jgi:hypothetical protein
MVDHQPPSESAAARMATLDRYNEMDDTLGRPVQPGSKPVLRLLRCDYRLRETPPSAN